MLLILVKEQNFEVSNSNGVNSNENCKTRKSSDDKEVSNSNGVNSNARLLIYSITIFSCFKLQRSKF